MTQLAIAGGANGIFYLSTTALASPVNGADFFRRHYAGQLDIGQLNAAVDVVELLLGGSFDLIDELEKEFVNGSLKIDGVPEAWNARYREYLGLEVPDDASGCLQDVHWTGGYGYFPS